MSVIYKNSLRYEERLGLLCYPYYVGNMYLQVLLTEFPSEFPTTPFTRLEAGGKLQISAEHRYGHNI